MDVTVLYSKSKLTNDMIYEAQTFQLLSSYLFIKI